jgi:hypothetical protein
MSRSVQQQFRATTCGVVRVMLLASFVLAAYASQAQTYTVVHSFSGGADGALPSAGLTRDGAGNFYGTSGSSVFRLTKHGSSWILTPLYDFPEGSDGQFPESPVTIGPDGSLYGTTLGGGYYEGESCSEGGCGVVYNVRPGATFPSSALTPWNETVLHAFTGPPYDGDEPAYGAVMFDQAGNIYGTTNFGGKRLRGSV